MFGLWIWMMADNVTHGPISRIFGSDRVDGVIDGMFYGFETVLLLWAAGAAIMNRRLGQSRRMPRVAVPHGAVNGQPVRLALDTGSFITLLTRQGARRLKLGSVRLSFIRVNFARRLLSLTTAPVRLTLGGQEMTTPLPVLNLPPFMKIKGFDGLLGWPEVRDNILFFDANGCTIRRLESLPPETAGWLKLKVHRANQLVLELPMANGATGTVLVDTGATHGLALPEARMKAWRAAHPRAPATPLLLSLLTLKAFPGGGLVDGTEFWADEFVLGTLTLTDIPLRSASHIETRRRRGSVGSIGLYALSRMDLIVDGVGGIAYLRPKPGPGLPYPTIKRPGIPHGAAHAPADWTLGEEVKMSDAHLLAFNCLARAADKKTQGDLLGALGECDHAIELEPDSVNAHQIRSSMRRLNRDLIGALADCNRSLELDPEESALYLARGLVHFALDDGTAAAADFDRARELGAGRVRIKLLRILARLQRWMASPHRVVSSANGRTR